MASNDRARIRALEKENRELRARVAKLEEIIVRLEERLRMNSGNSSMPPSTDFGRGKPKDGGETSSPSSADGKLGAASADSTAPSGEDTPSASGGTENAKRKPGGQVGHNGTTRALLDPSKVDHFHDHFPSGCDGCGRRLAPTPDENPTRLQRFEVPPIKPEVHEDRLHACTCTRCGHQTRATLPDSIPKGMFGVRLMAIIATLTGSFRLSKRNTQRLLSTLLGVDASIGAISNAEARVSSALEAPVHEAHAFVRAQRIAHADETSWTEQRKRTWLWTMVASGVAVFMIQAGRSKDCAKSLLERFGGILVTDRYKGYGFVPIRRRQVCWAHLERTFVSLAEMRQGSFAQVTGQKLLDAVRTMWTVWHLARDGTITRAQFRKRMTPIRATLLELIEEGARSPCSILRGKTKDIFDHRVALFTFVRIEGVEPTNNLAERAVRHAVILRKTSFGTHSQRGSRFIERMLTVHETLRIQQRDVIGFIADAIEANLTAAVAPSLLPARSA